MDAAFETMRAAGATVIFPIIEFCGARVARLRDPYGPLWLLILFVLVAMRFTGSNTALT